MGETATWQAVAHLMATGMGERLIGHCPEQVRENLLRLSHIESSEQSDLDKIQSFLHQGGLVCWQTMRKEALEEAAALLNLISHLDYLIAQEAL